MYYDSEYEIKKRAEFNDTNNIVTTFLNELLSRFIKKEYDEVERILIGSNSKNKKIYKYLSKDINSPKYIDEDSVVDVRVWTDDETRKLLKILYYVCKDDNEVITLNNKMIKLWLFETNNEMSKIFYEMKEIDCNHKHRINIKIEKGIWDNFVKSCKLLSTTVPEGFKACVNEFVEQRAKQHR